MKKAWGYIRALLANQFFWFGAAAATTVDAWREQRFTSAVAFAFAAGALLSAGIAGHIIDKYIAIADAYKGMVERLMKRSQEQHEQQLATMGLLETAAALLARNKGAST